jgi:multidrug efflux pump subunit AcrB
LNLAQLIEATHGRLLPILITTLTTLLAMLPFAVDLTQSSSQDNLAVAVIFGLLFSLIFSLFLFPWIYSLGKGTQAPSSTLSNPQAKAPKNPEAEYHDVP